MNVIQKIFGMTIIKSIWYAFRRVTASGHPQIKHLDKEASSITFGNKYPSCAADIPKIIWAYWNGTTSPTVAACMKTWDINCRKFTINVLDRASVRRYLEDFPDVPTSLSEQKVSDLVRLMLLEKYGGIWMDCSIFVTQSLDWVIDALKNSGAELIAFYNEFHDEYKKSHDRPIIESGFLAAVPGSKFISKWRAIYQDCIQENDHILHFMRNEKFDMLVENFLKDDHETLNYFTIYIAAQQAMIESNDYRLLLVNAEEEYYSLYYGTTPPRNKRKFAEELLLRDYGSAILPKLIKITGGHRARVDEHIRFGCYRSNSILGKMIDE